MAIAEAVQKLRERRCPSAGGTSRVLVNSLWHDCAAILTVDLLSGAVVRHTPDDGCYAVAARTAHAVFATASSLCTLPGVFGVAVTALAEGSAAQRWAEVGPLLSAERVPREVTAALAACSAERHSTPDGTGALGHALCGERTAWCGISAGPVGATRRGCVCSAVAGRAPQGTRGRSDAGGALSARRTARRVPARVHAAARLPRGRGLRHRAAKLPRLVGLRRGAPAGAAGAHRRGAQSVAWGAFRTVAERACGSGAARVQVDIGDCMAALDALCGTCVDRERVAVCGGSHGGFLAGHALGQHAARFKCAVMRNPVLDLPLMVRVRLTTGRAPVLPPFCATLVASVHTASRTAMAGAL